MCRQCVHERISYKCVCVCMYVHMRVTPMTFADQTQNDILLLYVPVHVREG